MRIEENVVTRERAEYLDEWCKYTGREELLVQWREEKNKRKISQSVERRVY